MTDITTCRNGYGRVRWILAGLGSLAARVPEVDVIHMTAPRASVFTAALVVSAIFTAPDPSWISLVTEIAVPVAPAAGTDTLWGLRLALPDAVRFAALDSVGGTLLISYGGKEPALSRSMQRQPSTLLAYDLRQHRVRWQRSKDAMPIGAMAGRAILYSKAGIDVIDLSDGSTLHLDGKNGRSFDRRRGLVAVADEHTVTLYDIAAGELRWKVDRGPVTGQANFTWEGSRLLVAADGIQALDLATGTTWSYPLPASRTRVLSTGSGEGYVSIPTLSSLVGLGGHQIESLNAAPLVDGDRVYFAAETTVVCFALETGRPLWHRHLKRERGFSLMSRAMGLPPAQELLGKLVLRRSGAGLVVASLGWAKGPRTRWRVDKPTIALLRRADGRVLRRVRVEGIDSLNDVRSTRRGHFLLAPDRIILMDDSLNVRHTGRLSAKPRCFFPCDDPIVIVTEDGIVALAPDSLRTVWERKIGNIQDVWPGWGDGHNDGCPSIEPVSSGVSSTIWAASASGLTAFGPHDGFKPVRSYSLKGRRASFQDGVVIVCSGRSVTLLPIP